MPVNKVRLKGLVAAVGNPAWVSFVWFGMTAAISLLESPARFTVASVGHAAAIDIGRVVFTWLNRAELVALVLLLIVVRLSGNARRFWGSCVALALILIAQTAWLLPELAARSLQIAAGSEPAPSAAHGIYAALELIKLCILLLLGFRSLMVPEIPLAHGR